MVGVNMPGMGNDSGFHIFWKNSNISLEENSSAIDSDSRREARGTRGWRRGDLLSRERGAVG
jgi:hypothetical protein